MKKRVIGLFLISAIFSLGSFVYAQKVQLFSQTMPDLSIQWGTTFPIQRDLRNPIPAEEIIFAADFKELRADAGLKYQTDQFDFTNHIFYMPTFYNSFQAGLGFNHHYYRYEGLFTENDFIFSARFRWMKGPVFSFEVAPGIFLKYASIDAIKKYKPYIFNFSYHFSLLLNWHVLQKANLWCALNLQDYFDYPLAISPFYKIGFDYAVAPDLVFGVDYSLKYIDMFFSAVYLNEGMLRFTCKVVL